MKKRTSLHFTYLLLLFIFSSSFSIFSQQINTVGVYSEKMNTEVMNTVILPEGYVQSEKRYPVLYLLHGYGGNHLSWLESVKPTLPQLATQYQMIIVCPDGKNSWYWDSPINPQSQYDTYVSAELISYMDKYYKTIQSSKGRAISGFSMGGHGALWLAIQHPEVYGATGSMSGGVDIRPFPQNWEMSKALGSYVDNKTRWNEHTVINNVDKLALNNTALIIDCGQEDFFLKVNEDLHKRLLEKKVEHTYIMSSGGHTAQYWNKALDWQLVFFSNFFNSTK